MRWTLIFTTVFFAIDQISKWAMLGPLDLERVQRIEILPPFLVFQMGWNEGVNFGLFADDSHILRWVLIGIALGVSAALLIWSRKFTSVWATLCFGAAIGGALGNALDRIRFGAVVDFLNMSCCGINNPYVFNLADCFVFAGLFGIIIFGERFAKVA